MFNIQNLKDSQYFIKNNKKGGTHFRLSSNLGSVQHETTTSTLDFIDVTLVRMDKLRNKLGPMRLQLRLLIYGSKLSGWEIGTFCVTFCQFSWWLGVKMSHPRANKKSTQLTCTLRRVTAWLCFYSKWAQFNTINNYQFVER